MTEARVEIPYQEKHSRLSVLLRPILAIPVIMVMLLMIVPNYSVDPVRVSEVAAEQQVESNTQGRYVVQRQDDSRTYYDLVVVGQQVYQYVAEGISYENMTSLGGT